MKYVLNHYACSSEIKIALYFLEAWKVVQQGNHLKKEREIERRKRSNQKRKGKNFSIL